MQSVNLYDEQTNSMVLEQFVVKYQPLVKKIALYIKRRLPSHVELDDLLQSGLVGLLEAKNNYKNDMGTTFETFASIRIRGSIIDSLRRNSWVGRDILKNMKKMSEAINVIEQRNKRQATTEEIATELGLTFEEHSKLSQEMSICHVMSLDAVDYDYVGLGNEEQNPLKISEHEDFQQHIKKLLGDLPEKEKLILSLYYVDEFTYKQIGEILDLTEARICQLHSQAIARIKAKMQHEKTLE